MTNEKVVVTKEVAEAIEGLRQGGYTDERILFEVPKISVPGLDEPQVLIDWLKADYSRMTMLLNALVYGYEVEKSPEEKVREYYLAQGEYTDVDLGVRHGVKDTLDLLGIKIEGVNA